MMRGLPVKSQNVLKPKHPQTKTSPSQNVPSQNVPKPERAQIKTSPSL